MNFQAITDSVQAMACVVSVEMLPEGKRGKYRIVTGNEAYVGSIERPAPGTEMLTDKFTPNTEYTDYLTRDLNFEEYCYQAAVEGKCLHSYANPDRMNVWFNMTFLPLGPSEGNLHYCLYIMEISVKADSSRMSTIDGDIAAAVLESCVKMRGSTNFKETMADVIKDIRDYCEAEHCCILTMNPYDRTVSVLCESFAEGSKLLPMEHYTDENFYNIADSWESTISGSNCLIVKSDHEWEVIKERNPAWYESVTGAGGKSIVLFPLKYNNELLGYMWALNFNADNAVKIKETLELGTFIIASEIGGYFLLDRLKILSSKDMLTGVMNRNEMNNYVDSLCAGNEPHGRVGVIFADLNGLKTVNDTEGHPAGDQLLKNAANVLRQIFDEDRIFRAGGDEFCMILRDEDDESIASKIRAIRKESESYDKLIFAIGGASVDTELNVRTALRLADERMYKDKNAYYKEHPERKMR
ncbi:MAG: GGDEF domain-containing protein [Lachnospiraceae bacterium]|nr:GGDEF domain-containing protein [Lachnospiraceae bacterium]